jgi:Family of unknown function (DUF6152)
MMQKNLTGLGMALAGAALLASGGPAMAHHSFALFDMMKSVTLEGTVKRFDWTNPHSWIHLTVVNAENMPEDWMIELPPAGTLAREGWNKNFLKPGERISVRINPLRDGKKGGALQSFRQGT